MCLTQTRRCLHCLLHLLHCFLSFSGSPFPHTHAHAHTCARAHTCTRTRGPHGFKDDSTVHHVHHSLFLRDTHAGISRGHVPRQDSRAGTVSRLFFGFARLPFMTSTTYLKNSGQLFLYMACLSPWVFQIFPCN